MVHSLTPADRSKLVSAWHAARFVEPGMRLGLGTGSTAAWLVRVLGARQRQDGDLRLTCVPTSSQTAALAEAEGIRTTTLDAAGWLDLTIDGADEFDRDLSLIKGGGAALLQEKIVATASDRMIVITDATKEVDTLGAFPLPVEVVRFGYGTTQAHIEKLLAQCDVDNRRISLRMKHDAPLVTDEGHHILDLHLGRIGDAARLAQLLLNVAGVVETGLFIGIAGEIVIGYPEGHARLLRAEGPEEHLELGVDLADIHPGRA